MTNNEFYDLSEHQLNINLQSHTINTAWGNLGYWKNNESTYPNACKQLTLEVANIAQLSQANNLLDTGFGCGDQLHIWATYVNIKSITGMNISDVQTLWAKKTLTEKDYSNNTELKIKTADCCDTQSWASLDHCFDRIIALDCIYHFANKPQYFSLCQQHMASDSLLVVSDLLLSDHPLSFWHKLILKTICAASHIPYENIQTLKQYRIELAASNLVITRFKDISDDVFLPFGFWLKNYIPDAKKSTALTKKNRLFSFRWLKYRGTAIFLAWGYNKRILRYGILQIRRS